MITPVIGQPGIQSGTSVSYRQPFKQPESVLYLPGGGTIDGTKSRDYGNDNVLNLRAGLAMGRVSASKKWAPSILGKLLTTAMANGDTSFTVSAASAVEIVRRIGTSGTFKLTGPPTANGVVRTVTVTFSNVNTSTGVITITAIGVNEVQTVGVDVIMSGGKIDIQAVKSDGTVQSVSVAFNTSWTQTVADIQTALIAVLGTSAVACAVTNTHDMTITFSGTGYAALPQSLVVVDISAATGPTKASVTRTTAGVDGRFAVGSFVQPTDGSENPRTVVPDGSGYLLSSANVDVNFAHIACKALLQVSQVVDYPTDTGLQAWLKAAMQTGGVYFLFDDDTASA